MSQLTMADFKKWYIDDPTNKKSLQTQKDTINQAADASNQLLQDTYDMGVADTQRNYAERFDANAVQRMINERQIAESMANAGLTNSGMNASQMTANQLSYGNQNAKLRREQQSAIETLAATLRQGRLANEMQRNQKLAEADINYNTAANEYASGMVAEQNKAIKDANKTLADEKASARKDLLTILTSDTFNDGEKIAAYNKYVSSYPLDATDIALEPYNSKYNVSITTDNNGQITATAQYTNQHVNDLQKIFGYRNTVVLAPGEKPKEGYVDFTQEFAEYCEEHNIPQSQWRALFKAVTGKIPEEATGMRHNSNFTTDPNEMDFDLDTWNEDEILDDIYINTTVTDQAGNTHTLGDIFFDLRMWYARKYNSDGTGDEWFATTKNKDSEAWRSAKYDVKALQDDLEKSKN